MSKVIYEGYRIGKNGGEHWVGTVDKGSYREVPTGRSGAKEGRELKLPKATSAIQSPSPKK